VVTLKDGENLLTANLLFSRLVHWIQITGFAPHLFACYQCLNHISRRVSSSLRDWFNDRKLCHTPRLVLNILSVGLKKLAFSCFNSERDTTWDCSSKIIMTCSFYAPQLVPPGTAEARISYGISVCPSVRLSRPGTDSMPGEIETPGLNHMIA